jgi:hypothetical protein
VRRPLSLAALASIALLWCAALVTAPLWDRASVSAIVYAAGSLICHQQADRSFHVAGHQLPVCARCFGLYAGSLAGVLLWAAVAGSGRGPARRVRAWLTSPRMRAALAVAAAPTVATVAAAWTGIWDAGNAMRGALAVPLGAAIGALVAAWAAGDLG